MSVKTSIIFGSATALAYGFAFGIGANDVANRCDPTPAAHVWKQWPPSIYIMFFHALFPQRSCNVQLWDFNWQWRPVDGPSHHNRQHL